MSSGWICLHRSLRSHWIWSEPEALKFWMALLMEANHETKKSFFNGGLVTVKRGQLVFGRKAFSANLNISEKKIRRYLELLESDEMIGQQKTNKYTVISITNYEDYQDKGQQRASKKSESGQKEEEKGPAKGQPEAAESLGGDNSEFEEGASKGPAKGQQRATPKQLNNSNNNKNNNSEPNVSRGTQYLGDMDFSNWPELPSEQVWKDYKKHRQAKKSPITQTVINKMATQLQLAADAGYTVDDCLAEQLDAGWSGFKFDWFQNRRKSNAANQSSSGKRNRDDEIERAAAEYLASTSGEAGVHGSELEGTFAVETGSPDAGLQGIPHMGQKLQ